VSQQLDNLAGQVQNSADGTLFDGRQFVQEHDQGLVQYLQLEHLNKVRTHQLPQEFQRSLYPKVNTPTEQ